MNLVSATDAAKFDAEGATGLKSIGFTDSTNTGEVVGIAAGVNVSVVDTSAASATKEAKFTLKDATGSSDVVNLTVNGANTAAVKVIIADVETINVTGTGVAALSAWTRPL